MEVFDVGVGYDNGTSLILLEDANQRAFSETADSIRSFAKQGQN